MAALTEMFSGTNAELVPFSALKGEGVELLRSRIDASCEDTVND